MTNYNLEKLNILVVDDYRPMRHLLNNVLRGLGVKNIAEARNGREALRKLKDFNADIIITDYMMAPISGAELIHKIRTGHENIDPFLPIIVVSAYTEVTAIQKIRDAGMTEFLAKPISAKLLYLRIRSVIEKPRPFIRSGRFLGPDRRRRDTEFSDNERRQSEPEPHEDNRQDERS